MNVSSKLKPDEKSFSKLLPDKLKTKSKRFFTPEHVAIQAAKWLSGEDQRKVLDIGAGVGKFCLFGAYYTKSEFLGIEIRSNLVKIAGEMFDAFEVENAKVIQGNIIDFHFFSDFNAFYLYNPFHENLVPFLRMDDDILLAPEFHSIYTQHTRSQLAMAQAGTRLVTFHGRNFEIPSSYKNVNEFYGGELKYWVKEQ